MGWGEPISLSELVQGGPAAAVMQEKGVYLIKRRDEIIYIGAAGSETFGGRIGKHLIKFLGWRGVYHPRSWQTNCAEWGYQIVHISVRCRVMEPPEDRLGAEAFLMHAFEGLNFRRPLLNGQTSGYPPTAIEWPPELL